MQIKRCLKMKICLINPPAQMNRRLWYPIGIGYVASSLINAGFDVEIIDVIGENLSKNEFKERLSDSHADSFGIGGLIMAFNNVVEIAEMIKEAYPEVFIFAGNTVGYTIPEILLKNSAVEAIVMGEGEITTVNLMKAIEIEGKIEKVKGISYQDENGDIIYTPPQAPIENLDDLPYPAWDLIPMNNYFENHGHRSYPISTVRGCPFNCTFCCKTFIDYKVRSRSPESIIEELMEVNKKFNIESIKFFDDLFLYNKKRAIKFCELKEKSPLKDMEWSGSGRADSFDEELIVVFKKSNCVTLGFGFGFESESASQDILNIYNKRTTVDQLQKAADLFKKFRIGDPETSWLIGAPNETKQTVEMSIKFCRRNGLRYEPHFVTPYPKTALYDYAREKGLIGDKLEYVKSVSKFGNTNYLIVNLTDNFTDEELIELHNKSKYFLPKLSKHIIYYANNAIKTYKNEGMLKVINKAIRFTP